MKIPEVGDRLGVSVYTVRRWIKSGDLPAYRPGKEYRIRESDLEEFMRNVRVNNQESYEWPGTRTHLKWLVRRIADEACKRIDDPKNIRKGDGWREMSWVKLERLAWQEEEEFYQATALGDGDPIWEAADKLVIDAMRVDKASGKESQ